jgi:hypothetical protein
MSNLTHSKSYFINGYSDLEALDRLLEILEYLDVIPEGDSFWLTLDVRLFRKRETN